jgi:cell wall-associated NlpC family hydrolase
MRDSSSYGVELSKLVGIPFLSKGRDRAQGLDCWGLVLEASRVLFGYELPDYPGYSDAQAVCDVAPLFEARSSWKQLTDGSEPLGSVVVLRVAGNATHAGIVVRRGFMLHTMLYCQSVIESYRSEKWARRVEGFYGWFPQ